MGNRFRIILSFVFSIMLTGATTALAAEITVTEIVPPKYDFILVPYDGPDYEISEGFAGVGVEDDTGTKWGFINRMGQVVVPPKYDHISNFSNGMAQIATGTWVSNWPVRSFYGKYGYINIEGDEVIPPQYDGGQNFYEGVATVWKNGKCLAIDPTGKELVSLAQYDSVYGFYDGLARVKLNGKWGFIDKEGKEVIPPVLEYDNIRDFKNGFARVENGTWEDGYTYSYISKDGKEIAPIEKYNDAAWRFSDGLAWVHTGGQYARGCVIGGKYGFIDTFGKEVISLKYDEVTDFSEGVAVVRQKNDWSIIDITGEKLVSLGSKYDYVSGFSDGLACVRKNSNLVWDDSGNLDILGWRFGFIDKTGKEVIPVQYESGGEFHEGLAAVRVDGKYGYIDKDGTVIVPFRYDAASDFQDGMARVMLEGKNGFLAITDPAITAFAVTQTIRIENKTIELDSYALKDEDGNLTNYVKLRDVAFVLNGTATQFDVNWDGTVNILTGQVYTSNGSEMTTPFFGDRAYTSGTAPTKVDGKEISIDAIVLTDDQGGAYTYYKLRDLGKALGFEVEWSIENGISLKTRSR